jgi:hypothetical protein
MIDGGIYEGPGGRKLHGSGREIASVPETPVGRLSLLDWLDNRVASEARWSEADKEYILLVIERAGKP